jgi:hypothetical protein
VVSRGLDCVLLLLGFMRAYLVWLGCLVSGLYEVIQYTLSLALSLLLFGTRSVRGYSSTRLFSLRRPLGRGLGAQIQGDQEQCFLSLSHNRN